MHKQSSSSSWDNSEFQTLFLLKGIFLKIKSYSKEHLFRRNWKVVMPNPSANRHYCKTFSLPGHRTKRCSCHITKTQSFLSEQLCRSLWTLESLHIRVCQNSYFTGQSWQAMGTVTAVISDTEGKGKSHTCT